MRTGPPVHWLPRANGPLMARMVLNGFSGHWTDARDIALTWAYAVERVTGIEPALSAWEAEFSVRRDLEK